MEIFGGVKKSCVGSDPQNTTVSFPWCGRLPLFILIYTCWPPQKYFFFGQHLSRDYLLPGHENPAMGFLGV